MSKNTVLDFPKNPVLLGMEYNPEIGLFRLSYRATKYRPALSKTYAEVPSKVAAPFMYKVTAKDLIDHFNKNFKKRFSVISVKEIKS